MDAQANFFSNLENSEVIVHEILSTSLGAYKFVQYFPNNPNRLALSVTTQRGNIWQLFWGDEEPKYSPSGLYLPSNSVLTTNIMNDGKLVTLPLWIYSRSNSSGMTAYETVRSK